MTTANSGLVQLHLDGGVARITLAHPARCNALTPELLHALVDALEQATRHEELRAVVLGAQGRHFSTGGDVARLSREVAAGQGKTYAGMLLDALNAAILGLAGLPCPVLVQVQGALTGGALGLVLTADLVVMTPDSFIQPWYASVGFAPDGGWTALLPARVGTSRARAWQLLNQRIDAQTALATGLAHAIAAKPEAQIDHWLETLRAHAPDTLRETRRLTTDLPTLARALEAERCAFLELIDSPAARAGMARFLARERV